MKRRIAMVIAALGFAAAVSVLAPAPASADVDVCAGQGTATTSVGLVYPPFNLTPATATFGFTFSVGACAAKPGGLTATGTVLGWCGLSVGTGVTDNGHRFDWLGVGSVLLLEGELVGAVNASPDVTNNESCTTGADRFLVTGAAVLRHCLVSKDKTTVHLVPGFLVLHWDRKTCV